MAVCTFVFEIKSDIKNTFIEVHLQLIAFCIYAGRFKWLRSMF